MRIVALLAITLGCVLQAGDRLTLRTSGSFATAPADAWLTLQLDPQPDDRAVLVELHGSPGEYRSSLLTVDGWHLQQVRFSHIGAGCYVWAASILGTDGKVRVQVIAPQPLIVSGREGAPCRDADEVGQQEP